MLETFANFIGLPLDHLNFVVTQVLALVAAPILRSVLHPSRVSSTSRNGFVLFMGLSLLFYAFGRLTWYLIGFVGISYLQLRVLSPQIVHLSTLAFAVFYLSVTHLDRLLNDSDTIALELTGPLMVMVQKVTSVAIFYHDGQKNPEELRECQQKNALRTVPTMLEYFSYMFQFHTLMAGPFVLYGDYTEFISGENLRKFMDADHPKEPSPTLEVLKKVVISILCAILYTVVYPYFPITRLKSEEFFLLSIPQQIMYMYVSTTTTRFKYYHAWTLAEAICNSSGLGFSGYGSNNEEKWDLCNNVDIKSFELGTSLRDCIAAWNKGTNVWLRILVYDRMPRGKGTFWTFALSALWHGFYPGYYLTFLTGALFTVASRSVRSSLRPHFLATAAKKASYDCITFLFTRVMMAYLTFSFILLEFWPSVRVYWNMYFWMHFMAVGGIFILPRFAGQSEEPLRNRLSKLVEVTNSNGVNSLHG
ncbi:MBOAT, membrane-bound O-acyltransferase family [Nesidiocoris tenuis]|uniref:MBOAT, membrane-bound O-acyltransferase family n=1 Tax=Nesidiocoris tenuis TaxID=355587 RepID=A0ABN7AJW6_9HEMI|nr:MBOAT, membrane-bound O-acyltransferase family [Nesidiocoris tenuis]